MHNKLGSAVGRKARLALQNDMILSLYCAVVRDNGSTLNTLNPVMHMYLQRV